MQMALILLVLVVIPNCWATWRVARSGVSPGRKTIYVLGVWLIPLVGANMVLRELRVAQMPLDAPAPMHLARGPQKSAPASIRQPGMESLEVSELLDDGSGLPRFDFATLDAWAATAPTPEARLKARREGLRVWLLHCRRWLGDQFEVVEDLDGWVLSPYSRGIAGAVARYMAESRRRVAPMLDGLAKFPNERGLMIVFDREADYHDYIGRNYPAENAFAPSIGMFINAGHPHFVSLRADLDELEHVITHETVHMGLLHRSLPLWLDEGLAASTTSRIFDARQPPGGVRRLANQRPEFWKADTLQEFWSGQAFHRGEEDHRLATDLARAMVETIGCDRAAFIEFANTARRDDSGAAAARAVLSLDLGEVAGAAIGAQHDAQWSPAPATWNRISIKG